MGGRVAGEDLRGGVDGWAAVGAEAAMAAVVEHDVGGEAAAGVAFDFLKQLRCDVICGGIDPVTGHGIPRDGSEADGARDAQDGGAARTEGRTEETNGLADDLGESVAGAGELVTNCAGCGVCQIGVVPRVVADEVACGCDAACECRFGLGEAADHEEGCMDVVLGEDVEEARGKGGIRAVIEGEGEFAGLGRGYEGAAKDLGSGPERGVTESTEGKAGSCGHTEGCGDARGER